MTKVLQDFLYKKTSQHHRKDESLLLHNRVTVKDSPFVSDCFKVAIRITRGRRHGCKEATHNKTNLKIMHGERL